MCAQYVCEEPPRGGHEVSSAVGGGPLEELRNKHTKRTVSPQAKHLKGMTENKKRLY